MNSGIGDGKGIKDDSFEDFLIERDLESTFSSPLTFQASSSLPDNLIHCYLPQKELLGAF